MPEEIPTISDQVVFRRVSDVRFRMVDSEAVVVRQEEAEFLVLNAVGSEILRLADDGLSVGELLDQLANRYQAEREILEQDLFDFLRELVSSGVIEPCDQAADGG